MNATAAASRCTYCAGKPPQGTVADEKPERWTRRMWLHKVYIGAERKGEFVTIQCGASDLWEAGRC